MLSDIDSEELAFCICGHSKSAHYGVLRGEPMIDQACMRVILEERGASRRYCACNKFRDSTWKSLVDDAKA